MALKVKALALGAAMALVACGEDASSGRDVGYTGSTTVVAIDEDNVATVAAGAKAQASGFSSSEYTGVVGASRSDPGAAYRKALARVVAAREKAGVTVTGAVLTATFPCEVSGSASIAMDNGSNPDVSQVGEYVQVSFDACDDGYETAWGSIRMEVTATDGAADPTDPAYYLTNGFTYGIRLVVRDFVVEEYTGDYVGADGDVEMTIVWDATYYRLTQTISGTSLANESGTGSTVVASSLLRGIPSVSSGYSIQGVEDYSDAYATYLEASEIGIVARACSLEMGGCIDLEIDPAFRQAYGVSFPESGTMRVTGAGGTYIEIVVVDASGAITLEYDVDGPGGLAPIGPFATHWDCLDQPGAVCL